MVKKMKKLNITKLQQLKNSRPIVMITAYDAIFASLLAPSADILLVGDSLNMSFGGNSDTLNITIDEMIYHTKAVCNGAPDTFVITDMPFGSYFNESDAIANALKVYQNTKADAIKIEGGSDKAHIIKALTDAGFAVCAHIGLLPQSVRAEGGYRVKGKNDNEREKLINDAKAVEAAGAFMIVIEGVKAGVATEVAKSVSVPVIGIGAGNGVDGQVLVYTDMLGLYEPFVPKFVKQYLDGASLIKDAASRYADEVKNRSFPDENYIY